MSKTIIIRQAQFPLDYLSVYRLWQTAGQGIQLHRSDQLEEIEKKLKRDPDLFLVALDGERIVGSVLGGFDGRRGIVYHLAVASSHQRKGIAKKLMRVLEERLQAKGCIRCYLLVTPKNAAAINFYEKNDWEHMDLLIYGKDLP